MGQVVNTKLSSMMNHHIVFSLKLVLPFPFLLYVALRSVGCTISGAQQVEPFSQVVLPSAHSLCPGLEHLVS